jgi:hypothetical protein
MALAAFGAGFLAWGAAGGFALTLGGAIAAIAAGGIAYPVAVALLSEAHPEGRRARALLLLDAGKGLSGALAPVAATWMIAAGSAPLFAGATALTVLLGCLLSIRLGRHIEAKGVDMVPAPPAKRVWEVPSWLLCLAAGMFVAALGAAFQPALRSTMTRMGLTPAHVGILLTIQGLSAMVGAIAGAFAGDFLMRRTARGHVWMLLPALLFAPWCFFALEDLSLVALRPALVVYGISRGVFIANVYAALLDVTPQGRRGTSVALLMVTALIALELTARGPHVPVVLALTGTVIGLAIVWRIIRRFPPAPGWIASCIT